MEFSTISPKTMFSFPRPNPSHARVETGPKGMNSENYWPPLQFGQMMLPPPAAPNRIDPPTNVVPEPTNQEDSWPHPHPLGALVLSRKVVK